MFQLCVHGKITISAPSESHLVSSRMVGSSRSKDGGYERLPLELQELLAPRLEQLGGSGEIYRRAASQPDALGYMLRWTNTLEKALPPRLGEIVALSVAVEAGDVHERARRERTAVAHGLTLDELRLVVAGRPASSATLSEIEVAAATLARCLVSELGRGCDPALLRLSRLMGEHSADACLMFAACCLAHAAMSNAWRLRSPLSSQLEHSGIVHGPAKIADEDS